jgi:hypothetical protein
MIVRCYPQAYWRRRAGCAGERRAGMIDLRPQLDTGGEGPFFKYYKHFQDRGHELRVSRWGRRPDSAKGAGQHGVHALKGSATLPTTVPPLIQSETLSRACKDSLFAHLIFGMIGPCHCFRRLPSTRAARLPSPAVSPFQLGRHYLPPSAPQHR